MSHGSTRPDEGQPPVELGELLDTYLSERLARREIAPITATNLRWTLTRLIDEAGTVDNLTTRTIERWLEGLGHLALSSRRTQFAGARSFCKWLTRRGYVAADPTLEVRPPRVPRPVPRALPAGDVARLLAVAPDERARAIVWLCVGCGLRCCEVSRLDVGDWDQRAGTLLVRGKGDVERLLPVPAEVGTALRAYLDASPTGDGPLVRSTKRPKDPLRPHTISGLLVRWMTAAEIKRAARDRVSGHALRHTAASDVLDSCGDLRLVQNLLGHSNVSTTSIYLRRASLGQLRDAMAGRAYADA